MFVPDAHRPKFNAKIATSLSFLIPLHIISLILTLGASLIRITFPQKLIIPTVNRQPATPLLCLFPVSKGDVHKIKVVVKFQNFILL